jgi:hypothetical protein
MGVNPSRLAKVQHAFSEKNPKKSTSPSAAIAPKIVNERGGNGKTPSPDKSSGANLKGSASGGNGLDDRTGLRTGTLQGSAFRPRDNCPVRAVVPDIQAQLP